MAEAGAESAKGAEEERRAAEGGGGGRWGAAVGRVPRAPQRLLCAARCSAGGGRSWVPAGCAVCVRPSVCLSAMWHGRALSGGCCEVGGRGAGTGLRVPGLGTAVRGVHRTLSVRALRAGHVPGIALWWCFFITARTLAQSKTWSPLTRFSHWSSVEVHGGGCTGVIFCTYREIPSTVFTLCFCLLVIDVS